MYVSELHQAIEFITIHQSYPLNPIYVIVYP